MQLKLLVHAVHLSELSREQRIAPLSELTHHESPALLYYHYQWHIRSTCLIVESLCAIIIVVLPAPVAPTKAIVCPAFILTLKPLRIEGLPLYPKWMLSIYISPSILPVSSLLMSDTIFFGVSNKSNIRVVDAIARWYWSKVSPSLVNGVVFLLLILSNNVSMVL